MKSLRWWIMNNSVLASAINNTLTHIHTYTQAYAPSSFLWDKPELALSSRDGHGPRYKDFPLAMRTGSGVSVTWIWMSTIWSWILSPSISTLLHLKSLASMDFTGELLYLLTSSQILLFPNRGERAEEGRRARGSHTLVFPLFPLPISCLCLESLEQQDQTSQS